MKPDIQTRVDIEKMVDLFYQKVIADQLLSGFFAKTNWEKHLPKMYGFWNNAIFFSGGYTGDPLAKHKKLHEKTPLSKPLFERWEKLFFDTIDELFEGPNANLAKQRAGSIATIMQMKIL